MAVAAVCAVLASGMEIVGPFLTGRAIDHIVGPGQVDYGAILGYLVALGVLYVFFSVFQYLVSYLSYACAHRMVRAIRADADDRLMKLPLSYYDRSASGDVISRFVNDATAIADGLVDGITQLLTGAVTILGTLGFMLYISPVVTLVVLLVTSILSLIHISSSAARPATTCWGLLCPAAPSRIITATGRTPWPWPRPLTSR